MFEVKMDWELAVEKKHFPWNPMFGDLLLQVRLSTRLLRLRAIAD